MRSHLSSVTTANAAASTVLGYTRHDVDVTEWLRDNSCNGCFVTLHLHSDADAAVADMITCANGHRPLSPGDIRSRLAERNLLSPYSAVMAAVEDDETWEDVLRLYLFIRGADQEEYSAAWRSNLIGFDIGAGIAVTQAHEAA